MGLTNKLGQLSQSIQQDSSNNIGIGGAVNASYKLAVTGATTITGNLGVGGGANERLTITGPSGLAGMARWTDATTGSAFLGFTSGGTAYIHSNSGVLSFGANGSNNFAATMTLTSGNVGIGTTSPSQLLTLEQSTTGATGLKMTNTYGANGSTSGVVDISMNLVGQGGTGQLGALIRNGKEGDYSSGATRNAYLSFWTAAADNLYERMRITSVGTLDVKGNNNNVNGMAAIISRLGSNCDNTSSYAFIAETGGNNRCFIYGNGNIVNTNNSYGPISDIKVKENIVDASPKLDDLMKVRVVNYNLKSELGYESNKQIGVIAQELEQVFAGLVDEHIDRDSEGNDLGTTTKSVKMSVFIPMLIKAMQEQQAQIEELKALINK